VLRWCLKCFLPGLSWNRNSSYLSFPHSLGWQVYYWLNWALINYLPGLALNRDTPNLCLLSILDYRCEPPAPVLQWKFLVLCLS
jgi:hypothetical protein